MSGEQGSVPDLSAIIGKLTENPAILSGLISSLAKTSQTEESPQPVPKEAPLPSVDPEMLSRLLPVVSSLAQKPHPDAPNPQKVSNPRCELLRALRPFLSPERCQAIDYMIKMDGLGGLLQNLK